jgi:metal-responsive CopG/Arc/MetJ family transcriptional regulator
MDAKRKPGRPPTSPEGKMMLTWVSLTPSQMERVDDVAKRLNGISRSNVIRLMVQQVINQATEGGKK